MSLSSCVTVEGPGADAGEGTAADSGSGVMDSEEIVDRAERQASPGHLGLRHRLAAGTVGPERGC